MWYNRAWYDRRNLGRRARSVLGDRRVRIASGVAALAALLLQLRRWRATRDE
ncbi:MAG: hypothetical protein AB7T31_16660 [Gemmatimonadales bacterium]